MERIVLDPVMVAQSGDKLLQEDAVEALKTCLVPMAEVLTPNLPEGEVLLGRSIETPAAMPAAAAELAGMGCRSVLLKGGHLEEGDSDDCLFVGETRKVVALAAGRVPTLNNHGTGCTLSSAVAAFLAKGEGVEDAARHAKEYITQAIRAGAAYRIGHGHGPVHHFWNVWE